MKKILLLKSFLLFVVFGTKAQFQYSFINPSAYSCDHYSIETAPATSPYAYACAGTFIDGSNTFMHVFTLDNTGLLVWEQIVNLSGLDGRLLDVTIGKDAHVAVTGFTDAGSGTTLYASLYDGASGALIADYEYASPDNTSGNNIIYSVANDQYVIGGFEASGGPLTGSGLMIALDGGFNQQWAKIYSPICAGFNMCSINEIVEVNLEYFITGNLSNPTNSSLTGRSQVLALLVRNSDGSILDNESFRATGNINQEAMGASAHFNPEGEELILLYNVSNSPTVDENRPYIARFRLVGANLIFDSAFRIEDTFVSNPTVFTSTPSFTGLKLIPNVNDGTYIIFGMLDAYSQPDDRVISVYQEIDLLGNIISPAIFWTQSEIPTGFPSQGGLYSLFNNLTLNTDVYSPESTTLSQELNNFVSILPTEAGSFSYDVISSTLTTANAASGCFETFALELTPHENFEYLCMTAIPANGVSSAPLYPVDIYNSDQDLTCPVQMSPLSEISENELTNVLTLFANPTQNLLCFSVSEKGSYNTVIMDIEGRIFYSEKLNNSGSQNQINIENLAPGIYILSLISQDGQSIQKQFVKE